MNPVDEIGELDDCTDVYDPFNWAVVDGGFWWYTYFGEI